MKQTYVTTGKRGRLERNAERGDASTFGSTAYMPFMFFVMVFGMFIAMVGFWRLMAVEANEQGTYARSVQKSGGTGEAQSAFAELTNDGTGAAGNTVTSSSGMGRRTELDLQEDTSLSIMFFGRTDAKISASSQKRFEQFYAGPADCNNARNYCEE
jgi:hypothetical protein